MCGLTGGFGERQKFVFQDGLGLKSEVLKVLPDPKRFYAAEFKRAYG